MFQKIDRSPVIGYQLLNLGSHWELHSPTGIFKGDLKKVCKHAVNLGLPFKELEIAVEEMERHFHDGAEFGYYKSFMFTFDRVEKYAEKIVLH